MNQVLQVLCPQCQTPLRIPAEWLTQPVRCKHCQTVFQGKVRPGSDPLVPAARAPQAAVGANVAAGRPPRPAAAPGRPVPGPARGNRRYPQARPASPRMKPLTVALLFSTLCLGIGVAGYFSWRLMRGSGTESSAEKGSAPAEVAQSNPSTNTPPANTPPGKDNNPGKENKPPPVIKDKPNTGQPPIKKPVDEVGPKKKLDFPIVTKDPLNRENPVVRPQLKEDPDLPMTPPKPRTPNDPFPRRALLVSVNDYLFASPVTYGSPPSTKPPYPGSSPAALAELLQRAPFSIPAEQIVELSDATPADAKSGRRPYDPLKQVIKDTMVEFLKTARGQDRIMVFFAGNTVDIDKVSYLVPMEGKKDDVNSLIPLSWVLDQLGACKAKQKVLILDVARFPQNRPGEPEMSEDLDALLKNPPAGVQVWSSCTKGQKSHELAKGGVFLEALCTVLSKDYPRDASLQTDPLPLALIAPQVDMKLKELLEPNKLVQDARVAGFPIDNKSTYDPDEERPVRVAIARPRVEGGEVAGLAQINDILDEIKRQPAVHKDQTLPKTLPIFSAKTLAEYKADYPSWEMLQEQIAKEPEKYALRKAVIEAIEAMNQSHKLAMIQRIPSPKGGVIDPKVKANFVNAEGAGAEDFRS